MDETYNCCSCIVHVLIINSVPNMNLFGNLSYFSFSSKEIYTKTCFTFRSKTMGRVSKTNLASIIPKDAKLTSAKALVVFFSLASKICCKAMMSVSLILKPCLDFSDEATEKYIEILIQSNPCSKSLEALKWHWIFSPSIGVLCDH